MHCAQYDAYDAFSSFPNSSADSSGCHAVDSSTGVSMHVGENMNANSLASPFSTNRIRTVRPCKVQRLPPSAEGHLTHRRSMFVPEILTHEKPGILDHSTPLRLQRGPRSSTATSAFALVASIFTTRKGAVINNGLVVTTPSPDRKSRRWRGFFARKNANRSRGSV